MQYAPHQGEVEEDDSGNDIFSDDLNDFDEDIEDEQYDDVYDLDADLNAQPEDDEIETGSGLLHSDGYDIIRERCVAEQRERVSNPNSIIILLVQLDCSTLAIQRDREKNPTNVFSK